LVITQKSSETNSTLSYRHSDLEVVFWFLIILVGSGVGLFGRTAFALGARSTDLDGFAALKTRLIDDGFDAGVIEKLYASPELAFDVGGISTYFQHREVTLNYDQFLTRASIGRTVDYFKEHQKVLNRVEKAYGVDAKVICAIILVETRFGKVTGSRLVLNTLSTLAALYDRDTRERLWTTYLKEKTDRPKDEFDAWAARKSAWAYTELKAYLNYTATQGLDPLSMSGSFAGALGIAQFIPSSVLQFAQDGNRDGKINLFDHEDAIESIANYLKENGWRPNLSREEALGVILRYNNSTYYAETILKVAKAVSEREKE
jgi:membrane-bound lytic murein transglycosylase B